MKHTIIAGMLLILILLVVVMNATFVRSVTDELYTRLNELPVSKGGFEASGGDDVKSFYALWSENRPSLSLSAELYGAAPAGDCETYCAARERLMAFLPTLADGEKPSFRRVF